MRILVADQNTLLLAAITATFGPHCDLVTATRRDVCLAQLEQHKFDVVIACDKLSDYTGLELLSEVPVISPDTLLIFAANPKRLNQLGKRLAVFGLFDTLSYPLTPQKLVDVLRRARERMRGARGQQQGRTNVPGGQIGETGAQPGGASGRRGAPVGRVGGTPSQAGTPMGRAGAPGGQAGAPVGQAGAPVGQAGASSGEAGGLMGQPKVRHVVLESEWDTGERLGLMARELQAELAAKGRTTTHDEWSKAAEAGAAAEDVSRGDGGDDDFVFEGPPPAVQAMAEPTRDRRAGRSGGAIDGAPADVREGARGGGVGASNRTSAGRTFEGTPVGSPLSTRAGTVSHSRGAIEYGVKPPADPSAGRRTRSESVPALTYESSHVASDGADDFVFASRPEAIVIAPEANGIAAAPESVAVIAASEPVAIAVASETAAYSVALDMTGGVEVASTIDVEPAGVPVLEEPSLDELCGNDPVFEAASWGPDESANEVAFERKPTGPGAWRRGGTGGTAGTARGASGATQSSGSYDSRGRHGSPAGSAGNSSRADTGKASRAREDSRSGHGSGSRSRGYNDAHPFGASQSSNSSRSAHASPAAPTAPHSAYVYPESPNSSHEAYAYPAPNTLPSPHAHLAGPNTSHSAYADARGYPAAPNTSQSAHANSAAPNSPAAARTNGSQGRGGAGQSARIDGSQAANAVESGRAGGSRASGAPAAGHASGSHSSGVAESAYVGRANGSRASDGVGSAQLSEGDEAGKSAQGKRAGEAAHVAAPSGELQGAVAAQGARSKGATQGGKASQGAGSKGASPGGKAVQGAGSNGAAPGGMAAQGGKAAQGAGSNGAAPSGMAAQGGAGKGAQRRDRTPSVPTASQLAAFERAMARREAERSAGSESAGLASRTGRRGAKGSVKVEPTIQLGPVDFAGSAPAISERPAPVVSGRPAPVVSGRATPAISERALSSLSDLARMATKKRPLAMPKFNGERAGPNRTVFVVGSGLAAVLVLGVLSFELLRNSHEAEHHMPHAQAQSMQVFSSSTTLVANREGSGAAQLVAPPPDQTVQPQAQANLPQAQTFDADTAPADPPPPPALEHPGPMEPPSMGNGGPPTGMMPGSDESSQ